MGMFSLVHSVHRLFTRLDLEEPMATVRHGGWDRAAVSARPRPLCPRAPTPGAAEVCRHFRLARAAAP